MRFLADSNRRTWFCRPLTKPLIQGTGLCFASTMSLSLLRFLADSNRRTRFCRPLTKPLIQGTIISIQNNYFRFASAKKDNNIGITKLFLSFLFFPPNIIEVEKMSLPLPIK